MTDLSGTTTWDARELPLLAGIYRMEEEGQRCGLRELTQRLPSIEYPGVHLALFQGAVTRTSGEVVTLR